MESRDYLLGQFLQYADLLHKLYCVHERKGSIPPQLIGNAAIPMALQSPRRALQVLESYARLSRVGRPIKTRTPVWRNGRAKSLAG